MVHIRAMGCDYRHEKDFYIEREHGYDCYLALFLKSRSILGSREAPTSCKPFTFILFNVNSPHLYGADNEGYFEDWIQFVCDASFVTERNIPLDKPVYVGERAGLDRYFSLIRDVYFRGVNDDVIIDSLMTAMLAEVSRASRSGPVSVPHFRELAELRRKIHSDPTGKWSVAKMAEMLHFSPPYLQELYKRAFGVSCMNDVIASRIDRARSLLAGTDLTVEEIAAKCGYSSLVHFSRQFRRAAGCSPTAWRKNKQQGA